MYVKVRTMDGKQEAILTISKLTEVEDFKGEIEKELHVKKDLQRLFFRGKQLEDGYKLYDYNINLNDVIQLMVRIQVDNTESIATSSSSVSSNSDSEKEVTNNSIEDEKLDEAESLYYKPGDAIDCLDQTYGAWFEAIILKIFKKEDKLIYNVRWEFDDKAPPFNISESSIRPRARRLLQFDTLKMGEKVMINHNVDDPKVTGLWYDFTVLKTDKKRRVQELVGTLHIGRDQQLENRKVNPKGEIFAIEQPKLLKDRTEDDERHMTSNGKRRRVQANCDACLDNPHKKCRECGCRVCAGKEDEHNLLLCDECNFAYHLRCLNPPLTSIPEEDYWYCPECKNDENEIVKAGDKLKQTKKKTNENSNSKRDWGKGMACVGRTKECSIVPPNHRGPIPGVEVGMCWMYRVQVSEVGVHRPHIAGIHGRETDCAYSIVLSGGYEDDIDNGDEFMYTGSGGRDLSGNKRTAEQSCDQTLTRMNKALAVNCNAKLNATDGATAEDWRGGIPVRVVRNFKLAKHSKYAPKEGNRYDGIYKVVKYYPDTGKSGFRVWRYLLRRDDPAPAPWTKEGKARIAALGLKPMYPDGYLEAMAKNKTNKKRNVPTKEEKSSSSKIDEPPKKKQKREGYELESEIVKFIDEDQINAKLWDECRITLADGKAAFLQQVSERFTCPCCLEVVYNPVTTPCTHNICLTCLKRSFSSGVHYCPSCRFLLDKNYKMDVNEALSSALLLLYPGYEGGR
ncbi:ubiquitin-like with PHD and ring finger domains 1 [Megachile rotundata]|uniref:ubiquitin-like with PHD and ring finger domains 1 n=1 Tax=Megachile rotundata TaxID=143995 RepID=UPI000258D782|nr:PREDICTED: E3 ubiquitin-protein ligase UHRF1 [Megachile rotundata]XP_012145319.1 PREDICTED: E3 ubiquitin-protein ligase UHRF1 [Megachile rotundata]XP_012145327.1 PREDICTED: E3 ubiquitin-protein ligase UHRF1 [Megachile rotundata]